MNYALNFQLWRKHSGECGSHKWWKDHSCVWGATEGTGSMVKGQLRGHLRQSSLDIPKRHRDPKCLVRSGNVHWCMKENYFIVTQRILLECVVFSNARKLNTCFYFYLIACIFKPLFAEWLISIDLIFLLVFLVLCIVLSMHFTNEAWEIWLILTQFKFFKF